MVTIVNLMLCEFYFYFYLFIYWQSCAACGILVPQPETEPVPPAVDVRGPNHWTAKEFSTLIFKKKERGGETTAIERCGSWMDKAGCLSERPEEAEI